MISVFLLKVVFGLFGLVLGLLGTVLWLAFWGFLIYLVLKVFAPGRPPESGRWSRGISPDYDSAASSS